MNTESTAPATSEAPAPTVSGGDDFTPQERAYFESRGEKGFDEPAEQPAPAPAQQTQQAEPATDPDDPDGTVIIDETGARRDKRTGRFVPHGAFHKERESRKAAEAQAIQLREENARARERLAILAQAIEGNAPTPQQPAQPEPPPDPERDIFGYVKWQAEQLQTLQKQLAEAQKAPMERINEIELANQYRTDALAYARENPSFGEAYRHLVQSIDAELQFRGVTDQRERMARIAQLEKQEVAEAKRLGRRPAEHVYKLAEMRGWKQAAQAPQNSPQAPSQPAPANDAAAAELARLQRGQNAAMSLSNAGGGAPAPLSAEALLSMSDAEFTAALRKIDSNANKALQKLLQG